MTEWQPIETAPKDDTILASDGEWTAVGYFYGDEFKILHWAVCQEYDWTPTHWKPLGRLPEPPK